MATNPAPAPAPAPKQWLTRILVAIAIVLALVVGHFGRGWVSPSKTEEVKIESTKSTLVSVSEPKAEKKSEKTDKR